MEIKTEQFGVHLMIDGYNANPAFLKDALKLTQMLIDIPASMGMHGICDPVVVEVGPKNRKDPGGFSGFVLIAESHVSFHTFPNRGFVTIDVYTCQNNLDTDKLVSEFTKSFDIERTDVYIQKRGLTYPAHNIHE